MTAPAIFPIDRLALSFAPKPWPFAEARRAEIDAYFAELQRQKPAIWNGRVLLLHRQVMSEGVFRGDYLETDYASFAAWRHWGMPKAGVHDCFGAAAVISADGAVLLGVMGAQTANAGWIYFPAGTPDPSDIVGGTVDLERSVARELKEETGLDVSEFAPDPGWTTVARWRADRPDQDPAQPACGRCPARADARASGGRGRAGARRHPRRPRPGRFRPGDAAFRHGVSGGSFRRLACQRAWFGVNSAP